MTNEWRGKRLRDGKWVYGSHLTATSGVRGYHKDWIISSASANGGFLGVQQRAAVDPDTLERNTGLVDKLGNEVYEGDVIAIIERGTVLIYSFVVKYGECKRDQMRPPDWKPFKQVPYGYQGFYVIGYDHETYRSIKSIGFRNDLLFWLPQCQVIGNIHDGDEQKMLATPYFKRVKVSPYYRIRSEAERAKR